MEAIQINNLLDADALVEKFLEEHEQGIATIHRMYFHTSDPISLRALVAELVDELRTGVVTFWNKHQSTDEIDPYLFYIVNAFCKKKIAPQVKKKIEYLCPACLYMGKENLISLGKDFECDECVDTLRTASDPKLIQLLRAFVRHNKNGYRCPDCERFIPHPLDDSSEVTCPYFDCYFVGAYADLKRMHHPTSQSNPEKLILDSSKGGKTPLKDSLVSKEMDVVSKMEIEEDLEDKIRIIKDVIESQKNGVPYSSSGFTAKHKYLSYQAFANLLVKYPAEMAGYLIGNTRSGGFQSKAFQEYIRLLEASFPFTYNKGKKPYLVDSLLDDKLFLFDGISIFEEMVNDKFVIKNGTTEFYIGGRKGSVAEPYYIGKLLNIVDRTTKESLMDRVVEYTFLRIKMRNVAPGTRVIVTHLRVPPHYQMGGMVYVNRVRKKIAERVNSILNKNHAE
jgi:hypothetical protein